MNRLLRLSLGLLCIVACAHVRTSHSAFELPNERAPAAYTEAVAWIERDDGKQGAEDKQKGLSALDEFILQNPTSPYTQSALYYSGKALEDLGRYSEAAERYRKVAAIADRSTPRLQALALYRLSFCTEALGDDDGTIAVLHDLLSRSKWLPSEVAQAEVPARLAGAYARSGAFDSAVRYYQQAEQGIARLRATAKPGETPEWLPRTLFEMGTRPVTTVSWADFETAFRPLTRGQLYLLETATLNIQPWAKRAADNLINLYQALYTSLESWPVNPSIDPLIEKRSAQNLQWQRAALLLDSLQELTARAGPGESPPEAKRVFEFATSLREKLGRLLAARPAGEGLTDAAASRRSNLRTVAPSDQLERQFMENAKKPAPEPKAERPLKKAKPDQAPAHGEFDDQFREDPKDPNL